MVGNLFTDQHDRLFIERYNLRDPQQLRDFTGRIQGVDVCTDVATNGLSEPLASRRSAWLRTLKAPRQIGIVAVHRRPWLGTQGPCGYAVVGHDVPSSKGGSTGSLTLEDLRVGNGYAGVDRHVGAALLLSMVDVDAVPGSMRVADPHHFLDAFKQGTLGAPTDLAASCDSIDTTCTVAEARHVIRDIDPAIDTINLSWAWPIPA